MYLNEGPLFSILFLWIKVMTIEQKKNTIKTLDGRAEEHFDDMTAKVL